MKEHRAGSIVVPRWWVIGSNHLRESVGSRTIVRSGTVNPILKHGEESVRSCYQILANHGCVIIFADGPLIG